MDSTKPITINRQQTILIEANEKQSKAFQAGCYETVLSKGIVVNNGDTITLSSAFVDTSQINPNQVFLPEDVKVEWNNGLYVVNQQLETMLPGSNIGNGGQVTDNLPLVLCQYHIKSESNMVLWKKATAKRYNGTLDPRVTSDWGNVDIQFQVMNANGKLRRVWVNIPPFQDGEFGSPEKDWDINIIGRSDYTPVAIDPLTGDPLTGPDWGFSGLEDKRVVGYIYIPVKDGTFTNEEISTGFFDPVINDGTFTIPSGSYEPTHIAKIITDGFSQIDSDRFNIKPVPPNHNFPSRCTFVNNAPVPTDPYFLETVVTLNEFETLPIDWAESILLGWNIVISYIAVAESTGPPIQPVVIKNIAIVVIPSRPGDAVNTFRVDLIDPSEASTPGYPSGGGATCLVTPPVGFYDKGSAFLQSTANYKVIGADGKNMFSFVDTINNKNIFTFDPQRYQTDPPKDAKDSWIGTNNVELIWDPDQKRFKFNYLHFPFTSAPDASPAIINQLSFVYKEDTGVNPPIIASYYRDYDYGSLNMSSRAYGGVFFTNLEPFNSFWNKILGFKTDLIVSPLHSNTSVNISGGIVYPSGGSYTPSQYLDVTLPKFTLTPGINTTEQLLVLGDLTGQPGDYSGLGYATFSDSAVPSDNGSTSGGGPDGRVAVPVDNVVPITADIGEQIGVQSSGYYIVDIDIGTTYNENVGSDSQQHSYTRNLRGVIDRYYSENSYTSSQGSDISYIHYGNSFMLSSLKIRFTNSNGTPIANLGSDNTIFLKVIKNNEINITPDPLPPKIQ